MDFLGAAFLLILISISCVLYGVARRKGVDNKFSISNFHLTSEIEFEQTALAAAMMHQQITGLKKVSVRQKAGKVVREAEDLLITLSHQSNVQPNERLMAKFAQATDGALKYKKKNVPEPMQVKVMH
jgi:hypothetical protein